ncbi:magnesium transporter [Alloalcanivorax profundimaris]|uniref:Magnesium transporter MgtE n=1 Tax=Alloalcanivorax profundimaris TaxID=2735259 RepID=A0ABS0ANN8_9GAMM|nr:magnesium transporter [Alloalcanivorax profundimaris]MBM1143220.1 magnesium transporter [Alcanivorax sp. ZXX171]MBU58395.1 magnesium transporter [Alcanivorax sp.]MCQ6262494.1 magnesium transporter [Alcanivorax sp. MM125-6]UWN49026.1 Magnesium transporter MgtE [Alcanivorax sp. ALC70]MBF1800690.1 magnesium transporter [Alloalcanivorax profundimaris]
MSEKTQHQRNLKAVNRALASGTFSQVRQLLNNLPGAEAAHLIESSPPREREILWQLLNQEQETEVLQYLGEEVRVELLRDLPPEELVTLVEDLDTDDLADLLQELPEQVTSQVLAGLDAQNRERLEQVMSYPEDTAGGLMNTDVITVRPEITFEVVQRYLRRRGEIPDTTDNLLVVNRKNQFVGVLPLTKVLISDPGTTVREAMRTDVEAIPADRSEHDVAKLFERLDLVTAPVVDDNGVLVGRITIDDVVDVIREEAAHSLMGMAGLDEDEDTFGSVWQTARRRALWLGINLLTALAASAVISLFEDTLEKVVALAVLMPIVASMGGIAGSQTLTLVIRAMALGQVQAGNTRYLLFKELSVGALNGLLWAAVIGTTAALWFDNPSLGGIIASAMVLNLVVAAGAGALIPMVMKKMGIDPALAGSVVLTTVTDIVGFMAFLGLATLLYAQLLS